MARSSINIASLMGIVAADPNSAADHVAKVYEWKYSEATTIAKALVGAGFALFLPLLLPVVQPNAEAPLSSTGIAVVICSAAVLALLGCGFFLAARRFHREYLAAQTLLGQLKEIQPFLSLYRDSRA